MRRLQRVSAGWGLTLALAWVLVPGGGKGSCKASDTLPRGTHTTGECSTLGRFVASYWREGRFPEVVEMLWAIASGSQMGPGEGWFHAGQSRYDWPWLARRHGIPLQGRITRKEFQGPADLFDRLDRNHDGALTAQDFDWSDRSPYVQQGRMVGSWFARLDADSNGRISRAEWEAFFNRAARGKDHLTPEDLRAALEQRPTPAKRKPQGPTPGMLLQGLLAGEVGSFREGPQVGEVAPDFLLTTQDGKRQVHLAEYRGKKPVVLVFGSFT